MSRVYRLNYCVRLLAFFQMCWAADSVAAPDLTVASICESAAQVASLETGVPLDVLRSITLTETGRSNHGAFRPWPWTVNMEGVGKWFDNLDEAQRYVAHHFERGARSFDVGCFQINYRWHGQNFRSVEDMFDPTTNARYAARFLKELFSESGDWSQAAGAYHSRTPKFSRKYRQRFDRIRANLSPPTQPTASLPRNMETSLPKPRQNRFPLLQSSGQTSSQASLVRMQEHGTRLIDLRRTQSLLD